jgi:hypothetical protein
MDLKRIIPFVVTVSLVFHFAGSHDATAQQKSSPPEALKKLTVIKPGTATHGRPTPRKGPSHPGAGTARILQLPLNKNVVLTLAQTSQSVGSVTAMLAADRPDLWFSLSDQLNFSTDADSFLYLTVLMPHGQAYAVDIELNYFGSACTGFVVAIDTSFSDQNAMHLACPTAGPDGNAHLVFASTAGGNADFVNIQMAGPGTAKWGFVSAAITPVQ